MREFIEELRSGDDSDLYTEEDAAAVARDAEAIDKLQHGGGSGTQDDDPLVGPVPEIIREVLLSPNKDELMAVAKCLAPNPKRGLVLTFHTPIGDVKTPVQWCSHDPNNIERADSLLLVKVRTSEATFTPTPGVDLEVSFEGFQSRLSVTCLAQPMRLYKGAGIDLLCFLPKVASMEKNGKLSEDAPSVVSGKPMDDVSPDGEPVAQGEKAAALRIPQEDPEEAIDFDRPRAS